MTNKPYTLELWQQMADLVLAVLIGEGMVDKSEAHFWIAQQYGLIESDFPPGKWYDTYRAASDLIIQRKPVHITTLKPLMLKDEGDYHAQLCAVYGKPGASTLKAGVFEANTVELKRLAQIARDLKLYQQSIEALVRGDERDTVAGKTMTGLIQTSGIAMRGETPEETGAEFRAWMDTPPGDTYLTGIEQMDMWLQGILQSSFLIIAAPMKQRKTTLLLNIMLNMVRRSQLSVALMMFENTRRMIVAQCVAMLALEYIVQNRLFNVAVAPGSFVLHQHINPNTLVKIGGNYRAWKDERVKAVDYGIEVWRSLSPNFRIYDRTPEGGGLNDCDSIRRIILKDRMLYETQFVGIDHAQRINEPGSEYEKLTRIAPFAESMARSEQLTICLLAQLNLAGANASNGDETYTSGIRGGSMLDEAGDYLFKTAYRAKIGDDVKLSDNHLLLHLKHNRYGAGDLKSILTLEPHTGALLNNGRGMSIDAYLNSQPF